VNPFWEFNGSGL